MAQDMTPSEWPQNPLADWQPQRGDSFVADTENNIGYLVHRNGEFATFSIATGQRRVVRYIGRTYNASTPNASWRVLSNEVKGDRITFGKQGRFLRLSKLDGNEPERTPYGIHSHAYIQKMLSDELRYKSMGCVLVSEDVLDVVIDTYNLNDQSLDVFTVSGLGNMTPSEPALRAVLLGNGQKDS